MRYNSTALRLPPDDDMKKHEEVLVSLRRLIRATDMHSKRLSKATGLTSPQLLIMQTIREAVEITAGDLARQVNLSQATITNILDRIEKRGWVVRQRSEQDKRKVYASLTAEGLSKVHNAPKPLQQNFVSAFDDLKDWEQSMIIASLQRVADLMDAQNIDASPVLDVGDIDRHQQHDHK